MEKFNHIDLISIDNQVQRIKKKIEYFHMK